MKEFIASVSSNCKLQYSQQEARHIPVLSYSMDPTS